MHKLGHLLPEGSQAPAAIQDQTLAFRSHAARASADSKEWCVGIRARVRWPSDKQEGAWDVCIISLYVLPIPFAGLRGFGSMRMVL